MAVLPGVFQAPSLFRILASQPVEILASRAGLVARIKIYQDIGICDDLPHVRDIAVFLRNLPGVKPMRLEAGGQGGFP